MELATRSAAPVSVYYDGDCPLCLREVAFLRARTPAGAAEYVDFSAPGFDFEALGVDRATLMGRIHARLADGRLVTGVEVFRRAYAAAGLGWLVGWTRWPLLDRAAEAVYALFARHRLWLTGRAGVSCGTTWDLPPYTHRLERRVQLGVPVDEAFAFFCDPANLEAITPADLRFRITQRPDGPLGEGSEIRYSLRLRGVPFRWHTRIREWQPGVGFVDEALSSPYALWRHRHTLRPVAPDRTEMTDTVDYRLPFAPFGEPFAGLVRRELDRIFDHRERAIAGRFGA